ncbi:MAG: M23 family metallopeptidase [Alphaproteobacteria bacterium]|nr:M23 family metallopeptidase [Alphaproteobacteria bacterium]
MMCRAAVPALVLLLAAIPARSATVTGVPVEGGLLFLESAPGTTATLDGKPVPVAQDGSFVIGFHRDSPGTVVLRIREPGVDELRMELQVAQREYAEQRIDGLPSNLVTPPTEVLQRIRNEAARVREARAAPVMTPHYLNGFEWPAEGCITGVYGTRRILNGEPRQPHYGIDLAAPRGATVRAAGDGVVVMAERDLYYSGGTLIIAHGQGLTSTYLHLSSMSVARGDRVRKGDPVATVGSTGRSTGPHLDWRFNWQDARIDPELVVAAGPDQRRCD